MIARSSHRDRHKPIAAPTRTRTPTAPRTDATTVCCLSSPPSGICVSTHMVPRRWSRCACVCDDERPHVPRHPRSLHTSTCARNGGRTDGEVFSRAIDSDERASFPDHEWTDPQLRHVRCPQCSRIALAPFPSSDPRHARRATSRRQGAEAESGSSGSEWRRENRARARTAGGADRRRTDRLRRPSLRVRVSSV